jgi:hypothetical protein
MDSKLAAWEGPAAVVVQPSPWRRRIVRKV